MKKMMKKKKKLVERSQSSLHDPFDGEKRPAGVNGVAGTLA